jgi:hypothetical protein
MFPACTAPYEQVMTPSVAVPSPTVTVQVLYRLLAEMEAFV